jgi:hypothetical protein
VTTEYFLQRRVLNPQESLPIGESDYDQIALARRTLVDAFAFEQKFDLLKENFIGFELAATEWSLRATVESDYSYGSISGVMQEANRHVVNLLAAARAYIDQVKQDFKHLDLSPSFGQQSASKLSEAYDASHQYRVMEALRNYAQHFSQPVHSFSGNSSRLADDWGHAISVRALKSQLAEDKTFKKRVLAEVEGFIDLRDAGRGYIEALSGVHLHLRAIVEPQVEAARDLIDRWIGQYLVVNESALGLYAHKSVDGKDDPAPVLLMVEWDDVRRAFVAKSKSPIRLRSTPSPKKA